jgi:hypothetical protein
MTRGALRIRVAQFYICARLDAPGRPAAHKRCEKADSGEANPLRTGQTQRSTSFRCLSRVPLRADVKKVARLTCAKEVSGEIGEETLRCGKFGLFI